MLKVGCLVVLLALASQAEAMLVTRDWHTVGDGLITYDSVSNLEFLAFSQTYDNHQQIRSELASTYDGFRFANAAELEGLFRTYLPGFTSTIDLQAGNDLQLVGDLSALTAQLHWDRNPTSFLNTCEFALGCNAASPADFGVGIRRHIVSFGDTGPDSYFLYFNDDNQFAAQQVLVRNIPEPGTLALMGLAMMGLAGSRMCSSLKGRARV